MYNYKLHDIIYLFEHDFTCFFKDWTIIDKTIDFWVVIDNYTKMISMHHFPLSKAVEQYMPTFLEKMNRRFIRLIKFISYCDNFAVLTNRNDEHNEIKDFCSFLITHFRKPFVYINIINSPQKRLKFFNFSEDHKLINIYFPDNHRDGNGFDNPLRWRGSEEDWMRLLTHFQISPKLTEFCRQKGV